MFIWPKHFAVLALAVIGSPAVAAELSLYCSNLEAQCREIAARFERRTNVKVQMIRKSTGEFSAQIKTEAPHPRGDVWWGGTSDSHLQAGSEGLLQPYQSPSLSSLHEYFRRSAELTGYRTTGVYVGVVGIGYNREQLRKRNLPVPRCWEDLLDPQYRGEIQVPDPRSSGTAFLFLASTLGRLGEDKGWQFLKRLNANVNQYTRSGDAPVRALALGETSIAIAFLHGMTPKAVEGAPVNTVIPCEGTGYEIIGMSMIAGAPNPKEGRQFIDFALTTEAQAINADLGITATPALIDAPTAPGTPTLDQIGLREPGQHLYTTADERARVLKRFEAEVR